MKAEEMDSEFKYLIMNLLPIIEKFNKERDFVNNNHERLEREVIETHIRYQKYLKDIAKIMKKLSIKKIKNPEGEKFDPKYHNALYTENIPNKDEEIVLKTLSHGYKKNQVILKYCDVVVNKHK